MTERRLQSKGDQLMESLAENYEQRLVQLQTSIQELTDRLGASSLCSDSGDDDDSDRLSLSRCSSNENLATELSQFSLPKFASTEDITTQLESTLGTDEIALEGFISEPVTENETLQQIVTGPFCDETEIQLEREKLHAEVEHLKCQNEILTSRLNDCENYCEKLTVLLGQYISTHQLLKTTLAEDLRLLQANDLLVSVLRLQKQDILTSYQLSDPGSSKNQRQISRQKMSLDKIQAEKKKLTSEVIKMATSEELNKLMCTRTAFNGTREVSFEQVENLLINFGRELRSKCNTLRIATPNLDTGVLPDIVFASKFPSNGRLDEEQCTDDNSSLILREERLQLKEVVASLKLNLHLKSREVGILQHKLTITEPINTSLREQCDLLSRECQRLEVSAQRSREPPTHSGCGDSISCAATEKRIKREKFLKRRIENLTELNNKLSSEATGYQQLLQQMQRDNICMLRHYERAKRKVVVE